MLKGEPEFITDLMMDSVIDLENLPYVNSKEGDLELIKSASYIDSKEGILELIKNVGKEAGFTTFERRKGFSYKRIRGSGQLFKKDESTMALYVPMEILVSGKVIIQRHILGIPEGFVNKVYEIYQKWPFLAVALVDTMVCHEKAHRESEITGLGAEAEVAAEAEANEYLLNKQGLWGVAVFVWYFTYYLNTRATVLDCIRGFGFKLDKNELEQVDSLVKQIDDWYLAKGGKRARRFKIKMPLRPAQIKFEDGTGTNIGIIFEQGGEGISFVPEDVEEVSEEEKPAVMKQFVDQLIIYFNDFYSKSSFKVNVTQIYDEEANKLFPLAAQISKDFDEKVALLIKYMEGYIGGGGEVLTSDEAFASLRKFLEGFSPYLAKYGYYFNLDITQPYPKPSFIGKIKDKKEAFMIDEFTGEKRVTKITYLERINADGSYWQPDFPVYLLPATEEIIIFEDLLLAEAKDCAKKIIFFKAGEKDRENTFIYKQWGELAGLSEEELVVRIKEDLTSSYTIGAIRDAFNCFFLEEYEKYPEEDREYRAKLTQKLAGLSLGPIPYYLTRDPSDLYGVAHLANISNFIIEAIEKKDAPKGIYIYEKVDRLVTYSETDIRELSKKMYEKEIGGDLVVGSLEEIKTNVLLGNLSINNIIKGKIAMDNLTFKALKENFINTGKIGNEDEVGWDNVAETLGLEGIKPVDLLDKEVGEIVKTREQWVGLVKLYPYLEMVKYEEAKNGEYLEVHCCALRRAFIFNKYEKELTISQFRNEENYIENKIKEYEDLLKNIEELFEIHNDKFDELSIEENRIPERINDSKTTIKNLEEVISSIKKEIKDFKKEKNDALETKKFGFLGISKQKKEEIEKETREKIEKSKKAIEQHLSGIQECKTEKKVLEEKLELVLNEREKIEEKVTKEDKQIIKCKEILNGLKWKAKEKTQKQEAALMM
jgi:hypothetical protein